MADPLELAQQMKLASAMRDIANIAKAQADAADRADRRAWVISLCSIVVAFGSLAVAIIALVLGA